MEIPPGLSATDPIVAQRPLRILSIAHSAVSAGGARLRYHALARQPDLDVHLVVPKRWREYGRVTCAEPETAPELDVRAEPILFSHAGPMNWYLHIYPGLRRIIRDIRPDVLHLWEEPWSFVALQALFLKGSARLVLEVDQNIIKTLPPPFETIRRIVLARTAHILARSPDAVAVVRAGGYRGATTQIGYGVDQGDFFMGPLRSQHAAGSPLRIGYVGRLIEEKGLDDVLDAMASGGPPHHFAILGEGPHEGALRDRSGQLGLQDRVSFRGWTSPREVGDFMRTLDVLVLLTRRTKKFKEQFGRVIIEAQACGVPVIGSTCGAIPSVIGKGGWVVPERDPLALASLLAEISANDGLLRSASDAARDNIESRFTNDAVAAALGQAFHAALQDTKLVRSSLEAV